MEKCHVLKIGRSKRTTRNQRQSECVYNMAGVPLTEVEHHPYLGIELDNMLSWDIHLRNTQSKSTRILNMIRRNFTRGTSIDIRKALYISLVRPHLEYSSAVWDPHHLLLLLLSAFPIRGRHSGFSFSSCFYQLYLPPSLQPQPCPLSPHP